MAPIKAMDRGEPFIRLQDGSSPAGVQQEHDAADPSVQGLAGAQATGELQAPDPVAALGGQGAQ